MQTHGDYITDRYVPQMVRTVCRELGIECHAYSDDWVIELSRGNDTWRIVGYTFDINSAGAAAVANDKVAAHQLMAAHGVDTVEHCLYRVGASAATDIPSWQKIVVKPLTGTGGHGVRVFANKQAACDYMKQSGIDGWAISPYVAIVREVRIILLDRELLLSYEKIPVNHQNDELTLFNLGKGAVPVPFAPDSPLLLRSQEAQLAVGLRLAAVDCVMLASGEWRVLEVNAGIMMEQYARASSEFSQQAIGVYRRIIEVMTRKNSSKNPHKT